MLKHFSVLPQDVSVVTVATAAHWLDFDQLASQIVGGFPKETTTAIVGYLLPSFVTQSTLKQDNFSDTELPPHWHTGKCFNLKFSKKSNQISILFLTFLDHFSNALSRISRP